MLVTCVIVVHNVPSRTEIMNMTEQCLNSFRDTADEYEYEIIFFDNGTRDNGETTEYLKGKAAEFISSGRAKRAEVIKHVHNDPIAKCWNEAIEWANGEIIMLLNNDIVFNKSGWMKVLIYNLLSNPNVGATGGHPMIWNDFSFLEGAFLCFRKETALQIAENGKVFDERFLFSCEEVDFCHRLETAGMRLIGTAIQNDGWATHLGHGTLCWSNHDGGWDGVSILDVMHESRIKLCRKYGRPDRVND